MAFAIVFCAVITMKSVSIPSWRARERTSSPDRSGMRMSTSARSNERARSAWRASPPEGTVTTVCPCWAQARSSPQRMDSSSSATRMVPGELGSGVDMILTHGQGDAEARAAAGTRLVRHDATVLRHDAVADCQAEPRAARLGGEEGREQVVLGVLRHALAVVGDRHRQERGALRPAGDEAAALDEGGDRKTPAPALRLS